MRGQRGEPQVGRGGEGRAEKETVHIRRSPADVRSLTAETTAAVSLRNCSVDNSSGPSLCSGRLPLLTSISFTIMYLSSRGV